ncbi:MAG: N-acetylmuramoyl-L-alanine amidase [Porphyromonadaceae bacterium]|nr:N-acetylmuramoyl-L-alanine amidase [Porphyromonadaceae bacterium]
MRRKDIKFIVLHCSATRSNMSYSAEQLEADHIARGFRRAGYHFYVRRSGQVVSLRPLSEAGAHAWGFNRCSIGVCYEGGLSPGGTVEDTCTLEQKAALLALLHRLRKLYPRAVILGHRDLSPDRDGSGRVEPSEWLKACPAFDAMAEYRGL